MRRLTRTFPSLLGALVLFLLVDLGLGVAWGLLTRPASPHPVTG